MVTKLMIVDAGEEMVYWGDSWSRSVCRCYWKAGSQWFRTYSPSVIFITEPPNRFGLTNIVCYNNQGKNDFVHVICVNRLSSVAFREGRQATWGYVLLSYYVPWAAMGRLARLLPCCQAQYTWTLQEAPTWLLRWKNWPSAALILPREQHRLQHAIFLYAVAESNLPTSRYVWDGKTRKLRKGWAISVDNLLLNNIEMQCLVVSASPTDGWGGACFQQILQQSRQWKSRWLIIFLEKGHRFTMTTLLLLSEGIPRSPIMIYLWGSWAERHQSLWLRLESAEAAFQNTYIRRPEHLCIA